MYSTLLPLLLIDVTLHATPTTCLLNKVFQFLRRLVHSKFRKCIYEQKIFVFKNSIWLSKNVEFYAGFKSVEKVFKKCTKKLLAKTWWKYALFPLLHIFVKFVLLIIIFGAFIWNFFNSFEISMKFYVLLFLFWFKKIKFYILLVLFSIFEAKLPKNWPQK